MIYKFFPQTRDPLFSFDRIFKGYKKANSKVALNIVKCDHLSKNLVIMAWASKLKVTNNHINLIDVLRSLAKYCITAFNKLCENALNSDPLMPEQKPPNGLIIATQVLKEGNLDRYRILRETSATAQAR